MINQGQERKRNLEREQDEIKKENQQRRQEIDQLKEMINTKKDEAEREKKYLKEALEEQEQLKNQLRFVLFTESTFYVPVSSPILLVRNSELRHHIELYHFAKVECLLTN